MNYHCVTCERIFTRDEVLTDCIDYSEEEDFATCPCREESPVVGFDELIKAYTANQEGFQQFEEIDNDA